MGIFSEELRELDRNTVQLMIDEMRAEIAAKDAEIEARKREIAAKEKELMLLNDRIREREE